MYPSGSVDPWRANSFTPELAGSVPHRTERAVKKTLPALMVLGASHHAWTHPPLETDQESVVKARELIASQVEKWLEETDVTSEEGRVVFEA
jgi:serine protease 16